MESFASSSQRRERAYEQALLSEPFWPGCCWSTQLLRRLMSHCHNQLLCQPGGHR